MLRVHAINPPELLRFVHPSGPIEFGRNPRGPCTRRVLRDPSVSAEQLCVEELSGDSVRVENLGRKVCVRTRDGAVSEQGKSGVLSLPRVLSVGETSIEITSATSVWNEVGGVIEGGTTGEAVAPGGTDDAVTAFEVETVGLACNQARITSGRTIGRPVALAKPERGQSTDRLEGAIEGVGQSDSGSKILAVRRRVQFEQFFSRELADALDRNPDLMTGRDCVVSILVSDLRDFSQITGRLGPRMTSDLIGDVLDQLTARIHDQNGVVVDYHGDGIMAMWGAPVRQEDHAARACRAAMDMIDELPGLNARWAERIGANLALGIGVNSGSALVGNTGSRHRMKYGPVGNTVNLTSRVEGATKHLRVPVLITPTTHAELGGAFATRRLCKVRIVGIDTPLDLYELHGETASAEWLAARDTYEAALDLFERGRVADACRAIFPLLEGVEHRQIKPELTLAARAIESLRSDRGSFNPVLTLKSK